MRELSLFAGAGGGILGGQLLGWHTVCAVENDGYAAGVLVGRQNDGCLPPFPVWDDVRTYDGRPWRGIVDVVSGGFPCQDISSAGTGAGLAGARSGLWREFARIISEVQPEWCFIENSPQLRTRGLSVVLSDLASMGYDAAWGVLGADAVGAPHLRQRMWIVAHTNRARELQPQGAEPEVRGRPGHSSLPHDVAHAVRERGQGLRSELGAAEHLRTEQRPHPADHGFSWYARDPADGEGHLEPRVDRVATRVANRVDRLKCIGNGQVPAVAALAWLYLSGQLLSYQGQ